MQSDSKQKSDPSCTNDEHTCTLYRAVSLLHSELQRSLTGRHGVAYRKLLSREIVDQPYTALHRPGMQPEGDRTAERRHAGRYRIEHLHHISLRPRKRCAQQAIALHDGDRQQHCICALYA